MPTLARLCFGYNESVCFTAEKQLQIKELAMSADFPITTKPEGDFIWQDVIMLIEDAVKFGKFTVKEILLYHIVDRLQDFGQRYVPPPVNEKCNVSVAGLGLLCVDTVKLRTDHCTDALQRDLEDGWKIIAICVQPDQRRPDYILGKTTKTE